MATTDPRDEDFPLFLFSSMFFLSSLIILSSFRRPSRTFGFGKIVLPLLRHTVTDFARLPDRLLFSPRPLHLPPLLNGSPFLPRILQSILVNTLLSRSSFFAFVTVIFLPLNFPSPDLGEVAPPRVRGARHPFFFLLGMRAPTDTFSSSLRKRRRSPFLEFLGQLPSMRRQCPYFSPLAVEQVLSDPVKPTYRKRVGDPNSPDLRLSAGTSPWCWR